ncbi:MAG TPA: S-layer homology domain-containing protein [Thermoanaerobaculia bacterium]|nr:S-layer homology domain-containing protein [Thermoanaerobaculia bacterium]
MKLARSIRPLFLSFLAAGAVLVGAGGALLGDCGPFTDVTDAAFCPFVLELFTLGITTGTSATTFDPTANVTRLQMAAFLSRTVDGVLLRGSQRAALRRFWTTQGPANLGVTTVGFNPFGVDFDGLDIWVVSGLGLTRVRASDGKILDTWTGGTSGGAVMCAMGKAFETGITSPGQLYRADPSLPAGAVTTVASNLGNQPVGLAFDGGRIWTANQLGSVSIVTPQAAIPWTVTSFNVSAGTSNPVGILYDGANVWVTDYAQGTLLKLDAAGAVLQTVTVGTHPGYPVFDGTSVWVPNIGSNSVSVVRASSGAILATLSGNGLNLPNSGAFDGQRLLVTNAGGNSVSVWKAADLSSLGNFAVGANPSEACSDGINFWITLNGASAVVRF